MTDNDIYSMVKDKEFKQNVDKYNEIQITGTNLSERLNGGLKYYRDSINSPEKIERLRTTQTIYKAVPEKDIVKIVGNKISNMGLARMKLKGFDKASFTIKRNDNVQSIVKSTVFIKQIKREEGRFKMPEK